MTSNPQRRFPDWLTMCQFLAGLAITAVAVATLLQATAAWNAASNAVPDISDAGFPGAVTIGIMALWCLSCAAICLARTSSRAVWTGAAGASCIVALLIGLISLDARRAASAERQWRLQSESRLFAVYDAVRAYSFDHGDAPQHIDELIEGGYVFSSTFFMKGADRIGWQDHVDHFDWGERRFAVIGDLRIDLTGFDLQVMRGDVPEYDFVRPVVLGPPSPRLGVQYGMSSDRQIIAITLGTTFHPYSDRPPRPSFWRWW